MKETLLRWYGILRRTVDLWIEAQAFVYAASLAFFTVFSIAPVVIVAVTIVGLVLGEQAATGRIMSDLQDVIGHDAAQFVQGAVKSARIEESGIWPTVVGFGLILVGATTVFAQMQKSLNAIWSVVPHPTRNSVMLLVKARVLSLTVVLAIGFILLCSLLISVALRTVMTYAQGWLPVPGFVLAGIDIALSLAVVTLLFAAIFRILPDVHLAWRDVWLGAFVTACLFTVGRSVIAIYLAQTATSSAYGAAGSLVLLLMWVNYSSLIMLFGAAFTRADLESRGRSLIPRSTAVRVHRQIVEDGPAG